MNAKYLAVITLLAASLVGAAQSQAGAVNRGSSSGDNTTNNQGTYTATLRAKSTTYVQTNSSDSTLIVTNIVPPLTGTMQFVASSTGNAAAGTTKITSAGRLTGEVDAVLDVNVDGGSTITATYSASLPETSIDRIIINATPGVFVAEVAGSFVAPVTTTNGTQKFAASYDSNNSDLNIITFSTEGVSASAYIETTNSTVTGRRLTR
jgi:hypothetical protein